MLSFLNTMRMLAQLSSSVLLDTGMMLRLLRMEELLFLFWMAESALLYDKEGKLLRALHTP